MAQHGSFPVPAPTAPEAEGGWEPEALRPLFPALDQVVNGSPLVYLDSGATAQRPTAVLDAEREFLERHNAAVHRGAHTLAALATDDFEDARETLAAFVGAAPDEVVWAQNATDALNLVAAGIGIASRRGGPEALRLREGDEILVTEAEHHANLVPWQELAIETGARLRWVPVDERGLWSLDEARAAIGPRTRIVAIAHVSNVTGVVAPVEELVAAAHEVGALFVLDACQSVPHRPVDLHALDVDFAAFSGHKMLGPSGIGVLYGRRDLLGLLPPARTGGSMITTVTMERTEFLPPPQRFEAGTQPVSQAVALAAAARFLDSLGMAAVASHGDALGQRLAAGLDEMPGIRLVGPPPGSPRAGLASFVVDGVHAHDVGQYLDAQGIAVRVGHHCTQPLHRALGVAATTRASTSVYTTRSDVDRFLEALGGVRRYFGATA